MPFIPDKPKKQSGFIPDEEIPGFFSDIGTGFLNIPSRSSEEFSQGIQQAGQGVQEFLHPQSYLRGLIPLLPIYNVLAGTVRSIASPITASISETISKPVANLTRRLPVPDPETLAQQVEGMTDVAAPFLIDPLLGLTQRGFQAARRAIPRRVPSLPPEVQATERTLEDARLGLREAARATSLPSSEKVSGIPELISPTRKSVVEVGQFGKQAFETQKKIAEAPFKQIYTELESSFPDEIFPVHNALATKGQLSGKVESIERGLRTQPERLAASPIGEMSKLSDEEIAERVSDLVRTAGQIEMRTGQMPDWLTPEKLERWANIRVKPELTVRDMILARRRYNALARGAAEGGNLDLSKQFGLLRDAYYEDIASVSKELADKLSATDKLYATNFIPKYGFESPAAKAVRKVGEGEGFLPSIIKPRGPQTKDDLFLVRRAKAAFTQDDWNVIARTFTDDLLERAKGENNLFNAKKLSRLIQKYRPETLQEIVGSTAYKNLQQFKNEVSQALAAKDKLQIAFETERDIASRLQGQLKGAGFLPEPSGTFEKQTNLIRRGIKSGITHVGQWAGPYFMVTGALTGNVSRAAEGLGLTFAAPVLTEIIYGDKTGNILRGMGKALPGTKQAMIKSAQIDAFLSQVEQRKKEQQAQLGRGFLLTPQVTPPPLSSFSVEDVPSSEFFHQ